MTLDKRLTLKIFLILTLITILVQMVRVSFVTEEITFTLENLSKTMFSQDILAFEVLSLLLTATLIGAIAIAKEEKK
ncbi:MAG: hypothetical protein ACE5K0_07990 [Candidatus Methanofastidiosia archaeon]